MHERIAKYLADEMDEGEKLAFENQLGEDQELREELYFQTHLIQTKSQEKIYDTEGALEEVLGKIESGKAVHMIRSKSLFWLRIAATLLIVITAGYFISETLDDAFEADVEQFKADNQVRIFSLSDGTVVKLNAHSTLSVSKEFGQERREITLQGAAHFDVASDPNRPFIIKANKGQVQVIGTSFEVEAYPNQEIELSVAEGKVEFASTTTDQRDYFTAGEKGILSADGTNLRKLELKNANYAAWWTNRLVFENTPFSEVIGDLEKTYRVTIAYDQALADCPYDAILENYTINEAIEALQLTFQNIQSAKIEGSKIELRGTSCTPQ